MSSITFYNFLYRLFVYQTSVSFLTKSDIASVCYNTTGTQVFIMQRSHPPCVFSTLSPNPLFHCVDNAGTYK